MPIHSYLSRVADFPSNQFFIAHVRPVANTQLVPIHSYLSRITRKKFFRFYVESKFQCACPVSYRGHVSSSLAEVFPLSFFAYASEQHRYLQDCGDAIMALFQ